MALPSEEGAVSTASCAVLMCLLKEAWKNAIQTTGMCSETADYKAAPQHTHT